MSLEGLKMDKEEIRYVWDGLEWGKEVYPGWRGGWRTLNPCLAMARRLGVIVVKAGSHWRLLLDGPTLYTEHNWEENRAPLVM